MERQQPMCQVEVVDAQIILLEVGICGFDNQTLISLIIEKTDWVEQDALK